MSAIKTTVGLTWTLIADFNLKLVKEVIISREGSQEMQVVYGPPAPSESTLPEWIVTASFIAIRTTKLPSGGQMYARMTVEPEEVVVNYD